MILYDSAASSIALTNILSSTAGSLSGKAKGRSRQTQSQIQSNNKIPDAEREKLAKIIVQKRFFQLDVFYTPDISGPQDYRLMVLAVNMDGKSHIVIWTDTSKNLPTGLNSIVKAVEELASK